MSPEGAVSARVHTAVRDEALRVGDAQDFVADAGAGAAVVFTGMVRNHADGRPVSGLVYESYAPLAERKLHELAAALSQESEVLAVWMEHRVGELVIGEPSVVVAVSAAHRAEAFECCQKGIDTLKAEIPIWKQEHWADGGTHWPGTD